MADNRPLSIDQLVSLLRLYLDWPDHIQREHDEEANKFYAWLEGELGEPALTEITNGPEGVRTFIDDYTEVLTRARHLKGREDTTAEVNQRQESRIAVNTHLFALVYDCTDAPALEGTILHGHVVDIARQGMRTETGVSVPAHAILSMTVAHTRGDFTLYRLTGQVRWSSEQSSTTHLGISIFNIEEHEKWENLYYTLNMGD